MSEPDWLGPASDLLREHSLDEAADCLRAMPARLARLERAVTFLEVATRLDGRPMSQVDADAMRRRRRDIIAEHRGYYREDVVTETAPSPSVPGSEFTEDEARFARYLRTGRSDP